MYSYYNTQSICQMGLKSKEMTQSIKIKWDWTLFPTKNLLTLFCMLLFNPTNLDHQLHQNCLKTLVDLSDLWPFQIVLCSFRTRDGGFLTLASSFPHWRGSGAGVGLGPAFPNPGLGPAILSKCCTWPSMSNCSWSWVHPCDARMSNCSHSSMAKRCSCVSKCRIHGCRQTCWLLHCQILVLPLMRYGLLQALAMPALRLFLGLPVLGLALDIPWLGLTLPD